MKKFSRIITIYAITALSALGCMAQKALPTSHSNTAKNESQDPRPLSFAERAYEEARQNSPFAKVIPVKVHSQVHVNLASKLTDYASKFIGTRYSRGASGPKAFDCSGFTSYIFKNFGISLSRDSRSQYTQGENIAFNDVLPGDLLFFSSHRSGKGGIAHVAMVVSVDPDTHSCTFIHASSSKGISYDRYPDGGYYSNHYVGARRVIGDSSLKIQANL